MRLFNFVALTVFISMLLTIGCSSSGNSVSRSEVDKMQTTSTGTIEHIAIVNVDGKQSWVGPTVGSVSGGLLGGLFGTGWGRVASSLAGSLVGNFSGRQVEEQVTKTKGLQLDIRLDNGQSFQTVVIPENLDAFHVGEKVSVIQSSSGNVQVIPAS